MSDIELKTLYAEIRQKICPENYTTRTENPIVFLVGAGISVNPPCNLSIFPQMECISKLSSLQHIRAKQIINRVRPEFFFQILQHHQGQERGFLPLRVLDTHYAKQRGYIICPNAIHYFLAHMLSLGHIVVSTNFDGLIEDAYYNLNGEALKNDSCLIYDNELDRISKNSQDANGCLIKIHGSFYRPDGTDTKDSIVTLLSQHMSNAVEHKINVIHVLRKYDWIVLGHSLRDEYDLYKVLSSTPDQFTNGIYWIKHHSDLNLSGMITKGASVFLSKWNAQPPATLSWKDVSANNMYKILHAYGDKSVLLEINTMKFIEYLWKYIDLQSYPNCTNLSDDNQTIFAPCISHPDSHRLCMNVSQGCDTKLDIQHYTKSIIDEWHSSLTEVEELNISAEILQYFNTSEYDIAVCDLQKRAINLKFKDSDQRLRNARLDICDAKCAYKCGQRHFQSSLINEGIVKAKNSLDVFIELGNLDESIYTRSVLANLYRLNGNLNSAFKQESIAIQECMQLLNVKPETVDDLAESLRHLALTVMAALPDIPPLTDSSQKEELTGLLEACCNLCLLSLNIYGRRGNQRGERGSNQTSNVLGLIYLRMGEYQKAKDCFSIHCNDANASRFIRESHQGYRNLGLSQLALAQETTSEKQLHCKYCKEAISSFANCLRCLNINPDNADIQFQWNDKSLQLNSLYNYFKCLVLCRGPKDVIARVSFWLKEYTDETKLQQIIPKDTWHEQCRLLSILCLAEDDESTAQHYAEKVSEIYRSKWDEMLKHKFGRQNYQESRKLIQLRNLPNFDYESLKNVDVVWTGSFDVSKITTELNDVYWKVSDYLDTIH